jgi:hypothetical protein
MFNLSNIVSKIWNTLGLPTPKAEIHLAMLGPTLLHSPTFVKVHLNSRTTWPLGGLISFAMPQPRLQAQS